MNAWEHPQFDLTWMLYSKTPRRNIRVRVTSFRNLISTAWPRLRFIRWAKPGKLLLLLHMLYYACIFLINLITVRTYIRVLPQFRRTNARGPRSSQDHHWQCNLFGWPSVWTLVGYGGTGTHCGHGSAKSQEWWAVRTVRNLRRLLGCLSLKYTKAMMYHLLHYWIIYRYK